MGFLEVRNLKKNFSGHKAIDDISFSLQKGSIFGLLGPNGAGKTTLLRMITGIFLQDAGEILFDGSHFEQMKDSQKIGYMPEERGLYKKMKIGEQAVYLTRLRGLTKSDAEANVKKWFRKLNMETWWGKKVEDLSKGMSQKLQFVTTVAHNPSLIILDEPFSGLDPVNSNLIKEEIFELAKNGATVIFSTHRMEQVEEICDHIILLNMGKKILDNTVVDAKQAFKKNNFVIELSQTFSTNENDYFRIVSASANQAVLHLNEGVSTNQALRYFIDGNQEVRRFEEILPSLNEIFIQLVGKTPTARQFSQEK